MSSFKDLRIVDNFYQTSSFFPMPTTLISTLSENGQTSLGAYSLCFPYYIAGKDYYAMLLCCRNNSNTAQSILRTGKCALNFITDDKKYFKEAVRLGFPGDTPEEKMANCIFELEKGLVQEKNPDDIRPFVIKQAFQVFECSWVSELENAFEDKDGQLDGYEAPYRQFNGITSKFGAHFILKVDKILMKEKQYDAIINGVKASAFPSVPVDYGYRDSTNFWYTKFKRPISAPVPKKNTDLASLRYEADRIDPDVKFSDDALHMITGVPRVFIKTVLSSCVIWAKENNVSVITAEHMKMINDKRSKEKNK